MNIDYLLKNKRSNVLIIIKYLLEKQHNWKPTAHQVLAIVYVSCVNGSKSAVITRMNLVKTNTSGSQPWNHGHHSGRRKEYAAKSRCSCVFQQFRAIKKLPVVIIFRNNVKKYIVEQIFIRKKTKWTQKVDQTVPKQRVFKQFLYFSCQRANYDQAYLTDRSTSKSWFKGICPNNVFCSTPCIKSNQLTSEE